MRLTRITRLRHRIFRDFAWPTELLSFTRFNVIYGWNGCGKTTLSSLLALVEKRTALTDGEVDLEFDGTTKVSGREFPSAHLPQVRVFNRDFVNAALLSTDGLEPIYFVGKESVETQAQIDRLRKDLVPALAAMTTARGAHKDAETKIDGFCRDRARVIKELLNYNHYDKRKFREAVKALPENAVESAVHTEEERALLRAGKDAQMKPPLDRIAIHFVDLAALEQEVDVAVGRSIMSQTLDELTSNPELSRWVQHGVVLHSGEHASDSCRFCHQPLEFPRRAALEAHFNDAFTSLQRDLTILLSKLKAAKQTISSPGLLYEGSRFYDALSAEVASVSALVMAAQSDAETALNLLITRVQAKRDNPFSMPEVSRPAAVQPSLNDALASFNALVDRHNETSAEFQRSVDEACRTLEASYVAEAKADYVQLADLVTHAELELTSIISKSEGIQAEIDTLERELLEHRQPAEELTKELRTYLGRDELRFDVEGTGYALTRHGQPVSHLSEGERTAIAFLYFLKSLQAKDFDPANGIVVVDDPVSSLDANALFSAFGYMKERTKNCGQLFILTHSFAFFRNVRNWLIYEDGGPRQYRNKKPINRQSRFYSLQPIECGGSQRTSRIEPLDRLLEDFESEYHFLFKCVYEAANRTGTWPLERLYGMPNIGRRLLEAFLAFRFPDISGNLNECLKRVVVELHDYDAAKATRISRLLNTYSHAEAMIEPAHDLSLLAETQAALIDLLDMMKRVDPKHFEGLERLVGGGEPDA